MTNELKEWLYTPCDPKDLLKLDDGVFYMPIGVTKQKIQYMEDNFGVQVLETGFNHLYFYVNQKEAIASGSIGITLMQRRIVWDLSGINVIENTNEIIAQLIGTATFPLSYYGTNTHYSATLESLCIVNAFGGKYPQFGSALNKLDVVAPVKQLSPDTIAEVDKVSQQLFKRVKAKLSKYSNREDAQAYLETTSYFANLECKTIVNNLPTKNQ